MAPPSFTLHVPREFLRLAQSVAMHNSPQRWSLLYQALWRIHNKERALLGNPAAPLTRQLQRMQAQVGRDIHKMHAFVRFRKILQQDQQVYVAFHRPDHYIVRAAAPFFQQRFRVQRWAIFTPHQSVRWNGSQAVFGAGLPLSAAPPADEAESLWLTYYASVFNPARVKTRMMKSEMPVRHWATLPETALIAGLLQQAPARVQTMLSYASTSSQKSRRRAQKVQQRLAKVGP